MTNRKEKLQNWLKKLFSVSDCLLSPVSGDASFRQYYRYQHHDGVYIVMDAPPDKENNAAFIKVTQILAQQGTTVPEIIAYDLELGFIVLSDFGDTLLLSQLQTGTVDHWYAIAIANILQFQRCARATPLALSLPFFNESAILTELSYFHDWFLKSLLNLDLNKKWADILPRINDLLVQSALSQPQVFMHRDFHARNLMVLDNQKLGVIDYQDAMIGPLTYDLVSLLRDCYIKWPKEKVEQWAESYYHQAQEAGLLGATLSQFQQWFDWMGLQRHLKVLGIFSRLKLRDNKSGYLADIPRVFAYVTEITQAYDEFRTFHELLIEVVLPQLNITLEQLGIKQVA